jgi:hypothetical protein
VNKLHEGAADALNSALGRKWYGKAPGHLGR